MKTYNEFFTEAEQIERMSIWARANAKRLKFAAFTAVSKGELAHRMRKKGVAGKLFAGITAALFAAGDLKKYNQRINNTVDTLEHNTTLVIHAADMLHDMIKSESAESTIQEHAMNLKEASMMLKRSIRKFIDSMDEYRRLTDDDKKSGILSLSHRELDKHDWNDMLTRLRKVEDIADMASKASTAASIGQYRMADTFLRHIALTKG